MPSPTICLGLLAFVFLAGSEAQDTFQFSSYSAIPQSVLDGLPADQREGIRNYFSQKGGNGGSPGGVQTFQTGGGNNGGGGGALQFSDYSKIPQSVLDGLSVEQRQNIRLALMKTGGGNTVTGGGAGNPGSIQTFKATGQGKPGQAGQTLQFSEYSQIPQSVLDTFSVEQRANIKKALMKTVTYKQIPGSPGTQGETQTFQFSSYSDIPESVLKTLSSSQRLTIKQTLMNNHGHPVPSLPGTNSYSIPGGNNKQVNNALNAVFNYVSAGGYLSGNPAIDLLLLRFYLNMGPQKYCG